MEPLIPYESWDDQEDIFGKQIFRSLVYLFEHVVLPSAIFEGHPMTAQLADPNESPYYSVRHFVSLSAVQCENGVYGRRTVQWHKTVFITFFPWPMK
jgi:hypothetical protein